MRTALTALTDELKRLRSTGVKSVSVSDESLATLRRVITARALVIGERKPDAGKIEPVAVAAASVKPVAKPAAPIAPKLPPPPVVTVPPGDKATRWAWLRDQVLNHPECVANVRPGKKVVLGVGSLDAKIMFVGEAPGAEEEVRGEPFVGPAGQLLTNDSLYTNLSNSLESLNNLLIDFKANPKRYVHFSVFGKKNTPSN